MHVLPVLLLTYSTALLVSAKKRPKRQSSSRGFPFFPQQLYQQPGQRDSGFSACMGWLASGLLGGGTPGPGLPNIDGVSQDALRNLSPEEIQALKYMQILQQIEQKRLRASPQRSSEFRAADSLISTAQKLLGVQGPQNGLFEAPSNDEGKRKIVIDTGDNFDRFVVHQTKGVDAFGIPIYDRVKSTGFMWGDGDIHFVNSNSNGLLGSTVRETNNGFTIPINGLRQRNPLRDFGRKRRRPFSLNDGDGQVTIEVGEQLHEAIEEKTNDLTHRLSNRSPVIPAKLIRAPVRSPRPSAQPGRPPNDYRGITLVPDRRPVRGGIRQYNFKHLRQSRGD